MVSGGGGGGERMEASQAKGEEGGGGSGGAASAMGERGTVCERESVFVLVARPKTKSGERQRAHGARRGAADLTLPSHIMPP